ncbi:MAG: FkbM family methyltransferase [Verrucomicrobiae bacterium]|nr:FkbM family methyltransferase [Verrucomicrobiae bacterium]
MMNAAPFSKRCMRVVWRALPRTRWSYNLGKLLTRTFLRPESRSCQVEMRFAGGIPMSLDLASFVGNDLYCFDDHYESVTLQRWRALAREASTVLDIGSHFGTFALVAAHENPSARVIAVEADKRIAAILRKHAAHYPKIEVLHAAVTEKAGWHRFRGGGGQRWRRKRPDEWGRKCRRNPSGGSLRKIRREIR